MQARAPPVAANTATGLGLGLSRVSPTGHYEHTVQHYDPFDHNEIGLAITTNESKPSLVPSSPSIYPPSLPPADDEHQSEEVHSDTHLEPQRPSDSSVPPPRPRRSLLRNPSVSKAPLITPPSSVSSHSPVSEFGGPFGFTPVEPGPGPLQLNDIMQRPTLLDIRPRSQDSVATKTSHLLG